MKYLQMTEKQKYNKQNSCNAIQSNLNIFWIKTKQISFTE